MNTLTLKDCDSQLSLSLDSNNHLASIIALTSEQTQAGRLELDFGGLSISLLNSSDLGVVVDNNGMVTLHRATVEGELVMQNPETGKWFSYRPDSNGVLVGTPV